MKILAKAVTGAAAAALITVTFASPAQANHRDNDGIDLGDIVTGVAIIGGIAAIATAMGNDGDRYGYDSRYRYRDGYSAAVNACGYEAERYGGGSVRITEVDRRGSGYRVRGVVENAGYGDRYGRYDRGYDRRYDDRYGRNDDRYGRYDSYGRASFSCRTASNGRITDFRMNDRYRG